MPQMKEAVQDLLRCPACGHPIRMTSTEAICVDETCGASYPIIDDIPILLDEASSVFSASDYTKAPPGTQRNGGIARKAASYLPKFSHNLKAAENYVTFQREVQQLAPRPRVLVLGGRVVGQGMEQLVHSPDIDLVETDVAFGPRTQLICDIHTVPFADASFDGVIAQAVLEHVVDPNRAVSEIHRVLRPGGIVYAEIPFMQQVHAGAYDFTRFTHLGLRRLFRHFEEIASGPVQGTGTALAWSLRYFALSFASRRETRLAIEAGSRLLLFWLKYLDYLTIQNPGSYDAGAGYFFLGRRSESALPDRELVKLYRGFDT